MRTGRWLIGAAVLLALLACGSRGITGNGAPPDSIDGLSSTQIGYAEAEPDPPTKALLAAGWHAFAIKYNYEADPSYGMIVFGPAGSSADTGHGSLAKPWATRQLKKASPVAAKEWRGFKDTLVIVTGDDWPEAHNFPRPAGLPYEAFQCTASTITAGGVKELPTAIKQHAPGGHFEITATGTKWSCGKTAAASPSPHRSRRQ